MSAQIGPPLIVHLMASMWLLSIIIVPSTATETGGERLALNFDTFEAFRQHHNKTYLRPYNEKRARNAFDENRRFIAEHNAGFEGGERRFAVRANHLADMVGFADRILSA